MAGIFLPLYIHGQKYISTDITQYFFCSKTFKLHRITCCFSAINRSLLLMSFLQYITIPIRRSTSKRLCQSHVLLLQIRVFLHLIVTRYPLDASFSGQPLSHHPHYFCPVGKAAMKEGSIEWDASWSDALWSNFMSYIVNAYHSRWLPNSLKGNRASYSL